MGPYGTKHPATGRPRRSPRPRLVAIVGVAALALTACSAERQEQWRRGGLPESASAETHLVQDLWNGFWIAALAVGVLVWGLILWASFAYRRRHPELPPQTRYNMPIEWLYTIAPFFVIATLFAWTVKNQNELLELDDDPDVRIGVIGQQWSWTFNYLDEDVYDVGTPNSIPTLVLPVDQQVEFTLESPDVIHSFWVPAFYFKMDVIPGRENTFQVTPNKIGVFKGKCAELCGTYHSRMLFDVQIVSQADYEAHINDLEEQGQTGVIEAPLRGAFSTEPLTPEVGENQR